MSGERRSQPPAAGDLEPALERYKVHFALRHCQHQSLLRRVERTFDGWRHGRRHFGNVSAVRVRPFPPGGRIDFAETGRTRIRTRRGPSSR